MRSVVSLSIAALLTASIAGSAIAQDDGGEPQEVRQDLMDEIGDATGVMGNMVRGRADYDPEAVMVALQTISDNAAAFVDYFPEGSETGMGTDALPAIWEEKAEFDRLSQELSDGAAELASAVPEDLESFQPAFRDLTRTCGTCHEKFRQSDD